jgi:hypothetical protein
MFGGVKNEDPETSYTQHNYLIQNGLYSMHGRGMYFDKNTGELYEGWFVNNNLI